MNPLVNRPFPIAFGGPGAVTVAAPGNRRPSCNGGGSARRPAPSPASPAAPRTVAPQRGERLPALRAAVPAAREIPDHLNPRQARVIPPPRPRPRAPLNALRPARVSPPPAGPPSPAARRRPAASGRAFSDDRPNSIRCRTTRSARNRPNSASRSASRAAAGRSPPRSPPASSDSRRFASSASASITPRDGASAPSAPGTTPAATDTAHSKHHQQPRITQNAEPRPSSRTHGDEHPRHTNSEYLLATCRVFVSLYSSGYFADERCGKEWAYFVSRGRSRATGSGAAIIPGVRDPVEPDRLPPWRGYR